MSNDNYGYIERPSAPYDERGEYIEKCSKCGHIQSLFSQADHDPEYYTTVVMVCPSCREHKLAFRIAVN